MAKQIKKDVHIYVEINMAKAIQELSIKEKASLSDMYSKLKNIKILLSKK